jgi:hypothetical protein
MLRCVTYQSNFQILSPEETGIAVMLKLITTFIADHQLFK